MKYEISREMFKQRLGDRHTFALVDVQEPARSTVKFEGTVNIPASGDFVKAFSAQYASMGQNVILYSLTPGDDAPARAADLLEAAGYQFVYFYRGTPADMILDKGLN
jgi:hypothetical protein